MRVLASLGTLGDIVREADLIGTEIPLHLTLNIIKALPNILIFKRGQILNQTLLQIKLLSTHQRITVPNTHLDRPLDHLNRGLIPDHPLILAVHLIEVVLILINEILEAVGEDFHELH